MARFTLRSLLRFWSKKPAIRQQRRSVLRLETLEDRTVPASLHVGHDPCEFATIQAAVNAAQTGDVVLVDPGTYQEQVTINKSITLQGLHNDSWHSATWSSRDDDNNDDNTWSCDDGNNLNGVVILAPANLAAPRVANPGAILHVTGAGVSACVKNLTITGLDGGTTNLLFGVRVDGGAFAEVQQNRITNIISLDGSGAVDTRFGVAVDVGDSVGSPDGLGDQVGSAEVFHNTIVNYQRAGVVINHSGSWAVVKNNKITAAAFDADSQTGVEVSDGAAAQVKKNRITGNNNGSNGTGVLLFNPGAVVLANYANEGDWDTNCGNQANHVFYTTVVNNTISGNDYGVFGINVWLALSGQQTSASIKNNTIFSNTYVGIEIDTSSNVAMTNNSLSGNGTGLFEADGGIFLFQSTNNTITNNTSSNNNGCGIYVDAASTGNTMQNNQFFGNLSNQGLNYADAVDLSTGSGTAGTANQWTNNQGQTFITVSGQSLIKQKPKGHR